MANGSNQKSTQKLKGHHSYASQTQDSVTSAPEPKSYRDGSKSGSGSNARDPDGPAPASQPRKQSY